MVIMPGDLPTCSATAGVTANEAEAVEMGTAPGRRARSFSWTIRRGHGRGKHTTCRWLQYRGHRADQPDFSQT